MLLLLVPGPHSEYLCFWMWLCKLCLWLVTIGHLGGILGTQQSIRNPGIKTTPCGAHLASSCLSDPWIPAPPVPLPQPKLPYLSPELCPTLLLICTATLFLAHRNILYNPDLFPWLDCSTASYDSEDKVQNP